MAKLSTSVCKKKKSILKLKIAVEKLQRSLSLGRSSSSRSSHDFDESTCVPEDVKEGHFAVVAVEGGDPKRFVVPLSYLAHPTFLLLLEQAAEEFGFDHDGALAIPCRPSELEKILEEERSDRSSDGGGSHVIWGSCESMVQSY